ncbi:hypothetical protein AB0O80_10690 [Rothia kristinae]|uniref:hypothetical protein n=1 Tax=Actinomycetes TaxID=1760 RepID=UPI00343055FE
MNTETTTYQATFELDHEGNPYIDIDTRGEDLDHPTMPNFGATTHVPYQGSEEYEPEVYRTALAEEGWEVITESENDPWTVRQAKA